MEYLFAENEGVWSSIIKGKTLRTDSTVVETGSNEKQSPNDSIESDSIGLVTSGEQLEHVIRQIS